METVTKYRLKLVRSRSYKKPHSITQPEQLYKYLWPKVFKDEHREVFAVVLLATDNSVTGFSTLSHGTLDSTCIDPRSVFQFALLGNASKIICVHNHPSGQLTISREDERVTTKLREAGKILGINLLDHIIMTERGFVSLDKEGLL